MSVRALVPGANDDRRLLVQAAIALCAVGVVALLVTAVLWLTLSVAPPAPRSPFGMGVREAAPSTTGIGRLILGWQSAFFTSLRAALAAIRTDASALPWLLGVGFAYGVFHAAGPGHGKAVIASYLVSSERALLRGAGLSLAAALIQAIVAILLVTIVFGIVGGTVVTMGRTTQAVEIAGFLTISVLGAVLVWRKAARLLAILRPGGTRPSIEACECGRIDPAGLENGSLRQMALVALGAGIRPCAGALLVLTFTRAQGIFWVGIVTTLAMALGTAVTTGGLAALAVYTKRLALRLAAGRSRLALVLSGGAELAAAAFVLVIGLALLAGYWDGAGGT